MRRRTFLTATAFFCLAAALAAAALHQLARRVWPDQELLPDLAVFFSAGLFVLLVVRRWLRDVASGDRALHDSEARYRSLVASMDDLVFTLDDRQRFTGVFGRWLTRHGGTPEAFTGRSVVEVFGGEHAARHDAAFARLAAGNSVKYGWSATFAGQPFIFETSLSPLCDDTGCVAGAVGVTSDVTSARELDRAYRETSELVEAVIAASPVAIFTLDEQGRIRSANTAAEAILGKPQAELMGELLVRPAESDDVARMIRDCAASGKSFTEVEVMRWRNDGHCVTLSISAAPLLRARTGGPVVVALATDVSERRRAREILERYRLMTQHIRDAALFVGPGGRIVDANDAAVAMYGWSKEELAGLSYETIAGGDGPEACDALETRHHHRDGHQVPVEVSSVAAEIDGKRYLLVLARNIEARLRRRALETLLHEIDIDILQNRPLDSILNFVCERVAAQYPLALVQLSLKGDGGRVLVRAGAGFGAEFLGQLDVRWDDSEEGQGPTGSAIRTAQVQYRDLADDPGFVRWRDRALGSGFRSALAIPLIVNTEVLGALTMFMQTREGIDGEALNFLFTFADQIAISLQLARSREQIALQLVALESAANAVVVAAPDGTIRWVNAAFVRLTGYPPEEAIGQRTSLLKSGNHSPAFYRQMWETVTSGKPWSGELWNRRKDGSLYLEEQTITPALSDDGAITHFVAIKQDVTARKRQEDEIRHLALHDGLTDLPNRRALDAALERMTYQARTGTPGALIVLDVDNFRPINDTLGHLGGDQLLSEVARMLRHTVRPADFIARLGGDEFAVLLHDTSVSGAQAIAERIRTAVSSAPFRYRDRHFDLTVSIGIAAIDSETDAATAMIHADSAMYAAKDGGRHRIVVYTPEDEEGLRVIESGRWASRIAAALREERFVLMYQPVVRIGNGEHEHHEALIRMIDECGNLVPPDEFLFAAERYGMMPQIDRWVIENVMKVLASSDTSARIFVNISGVSLGDQDLLAFIERRIHESKLAAGRLAFEITESAAIRDLTAAQSWIRRLKDLGCLFAIDDFGVGFSSFSYLRALSADYVKIDRSFISDVDVNPTNRALVQAVLTVAQTLGKEVIAEGIETEAHASILQALGVELGQGYRWGIPRSDPFSELAQSAC